MPGFPKAKPPANRVALERWIAQKAQEDGIAAARLRRALSFMVLSAVLARFVDDLYFLRQCSRETVRIRLGRKAYGDELLPPHQDLRVHGLDQGGPRLGLCLRPSGREVADVGHRAADLDGLCCHRVGFRRSLGPKLRRLVDEVALRDPSGREGIGELASTALGRPVVWRRLGGSWGVECAGNSLGYRVVETEPRDLGFDRGQSRLACPDLR